jgi:hypothetical protein
VKKKKKKGWSREAKIALAGSLLVLLKTILDLLFKLLDE